MEYIPPLDFRQRYVLVTHIAGGHYGDVFGCDDNVHAVKRLGGETRKPFFNPITSQAMVSAITELNVYAMFHHPCLGEAKAWSFQSATRDKCGRIYIAMPLGEAPVAKLKAGEITLCDVAKDLIAGVMHMNNNGWIHGDIKAANLVYHNGHTRLIDFGLARPVIQVGVEKYFTGVAYTESHRDPECYPDRPMLNDIRTELYAIAKTLHELHYKAFVDDGWYDPDAEMYGFETEVTEVDAIIEMCTVFPIKKRLHITEIASELGIVEHADAGYKVWDNIGHRGVGDDMRRSMKHMVKLSQSINASARAVFVALNLMHQTASLHPQLETIHAFACLCLAQCAIYDSLPGLWTHASWFKVQVPALIDAMVMVMQETKCLTMCLTYWDYACSGVYLPVLLDDTMAVDYLSTRIRTSPVGMAITSKDVGTVSVIYTNGFDPTDLPTTYEPSVVHPCVKATLETLAPDAFHQMAMGLDADGHEIRDSVDPKAIILHPAVPPRLTQDEIAVLLRHRCAYITSLDETDKARLRERFNRSARGCETRCLLEIDFT